MTKNLGRELLKGAALCLLLLFALAYGVAHADIVTEIGGGYKFHQSDVLNPLCKQVLIVDARNGFQLDAQGRIKTSPCGGDDPVFIGWPIAWDFANGNTRIGWFHMSNWFDGGELDWSRHADQFEADFDCLCVRHTFHWFRRK